MVKYVATVKIQQAVRAWRTKDAEIQEHSHSFTRLGVKQTCIGVNKTDCDTVDQTRYEESANEMTNRQNKAWADESDEATDRIGLQAVKFHSVNEPNRAKIYVDKESEDGNENAVHEKLDWHDKDQFAKKEEFEGVPPAPRAVLQSEAAFDIDANGARKLRQGVQERIVKVEQQTVLLGSLVSGGAGLQPSMEKAKDGNIAEH